uniref:atypical chemokine receptor 3-like n=1 Tax=Myxine glutinosa TaxID=7769 RepID=UPI00358E52C6
MELSMLDYHDTLNESTLNFWDIMSCNGTLYWQGDDSCACPKHVDQQAFVLCISIIYFLVFAGGVLGNLAVIGFNVFGRKGHHDTHLYIVNLAIADLFVSLTLPAQALSLLRHNEWWLGSFMCKATHSIFSINVFSSVFFLVCMSVDRYFSLVRGFHAQRSSHVGLIACGISWIVAVLASLPEIIYLQVDVSSSYLNTTICHLAFTLESHNKWNAAIELIYNILGFILPFPVMVMCYIPLARAMNMSGVAQKSTGRRIVLAYLVVFVACWMPFHMAVFISALFHLQVLSYSCFLDEALYVATLATQGLALLHCCINPMLYSFINKKHRQDFIRPIAVTFKKRSVHRGMLPGPETSRDSVTDQTTLELTKIAFLGTV